MKTKAMIDLCYFTTGHYLIFVVREQTAELREQTAELLGRPPRVSSCLVDSSRLYKRRQMSARRHASPAENCQAH